MNYIFSTLNFSVRYPKFFITLSLLTGCLFVSLQSYSQFSRDTVFSLALAATSAKTYPEVKPPNTQQFYLKDAFSVLQTNRWKDRNMVNPKTLGAAIALGNNYFPEIDSLIRQQNLPPSFKWIPLSLSAMQYNFYGPDGRAGLWQLPHLVAVRYNLMLTHDMDQRLDPIQNTRVALHYLSDLIHAFGGDTNMALLAFFNSEGSVRAALSKMETVRFKDEAAKMNYIFEQLPTSTREDIFLWNYISSILPDEVPFTEKHPNGLLTSEDSVQIKNQTLLISLALLLKTSEKEIRAYNPSLREKKIPADAFIFLPKQQKDSLAANMDQLQQQQDSLIQTRKVIVEKKPVVPPENTFNIMYTVRQGDNLGRIAMNHRVSIRQLKEWNNLKSDRINVGQQLIIYTKEQIKSTAPASNRVAKEQKLEPGTYTEYTVKQGDSLWSISQQFPGVTVDDIMRWNNIGERIDIGQVLKIKKP